MTNARIEYLLVVGPLFATGPFVRADTQWTRCESSLYRTDLETGETIKQQQWWLHAGASVGWWFTWR